MQQQSQDFLNGVKHGIDAAAGITAFGTFFGLLTGFISAVAALLSAIWLVIRLIEWGEKRFGWRVFGGRRPT